MTWAVPNWYAAALLAFAAYRVWRLLAHDAVLQRPRDWLLNNHESIEAFTICGYCFGAWCAIAWWLAWSWQPHWTLIAAVPFAISAVVALLAVNLDPD